MTQDRLHGLALLDINRVIVVIAEIEHFAKSGNGK